MRTSTCEAPASFAVLIAASLTAANGRARKSASTFLFTSEPYVKFRARASTLGYKSHFKCDLADKGGTHSDPLDSSARGNPQQKPLLKKSR